MASYSIGPTANLFPTLDFISVTADLRVANTSGAPVELTVNAYQADGSSPPGTPAVLYFSTTVSLDTDNVAFFNISTTVPAYEITVTTPSAATGDISISALGRDSFGFPALDQSFPFGAWGVVMVG